MRSAKYFILTVILIAGITSALAQDIYIYPNEKLADQRSIEYRRYTLEEARAYEQGGSFDSYLPLDWGPERRLTEQENVYRARVVTSGDSLLSTYMTISAHATYFIRSLNGGIDWEPFITLEDTSRILFHLWPEIMKNGSDLMIGLGIQEQGEGNSLYYYRSINNGSTWSDLIRILPNTSWDYDYFASFDNVSNTVYGSYMNGARDSIYILRSTNWGSSWNGRGVNVAYLSSTPQPMTVRASEYTVHLIWVNGGSPISCRYSRSTDMGQTWTEEIDIAMDEDGAQRVFVAVQDNHVVVCWMGYKYSPYGFTGDLFFRQSFDSGVTWDNEQVLTEYHKVRIGTVFCEEGLISVVWMDNRLGGGNDEVITRTSHDYGLSWTEEERLSFGDDHSYDFMSCKTDDIIHVLWGDIRPEAPGLYYCRNDLSTGIEHRETSPPADIYLSSYPNPFNSSTAIKDNLPEASNVVIEVFDILGRRVETLAQGEQAAGHHHVVWDAGDASSGIYFYKIMTHDHSETKRMILIK